MRRNVLVVDDNELNRMILANALSDEYDIMEAENGKKALEIISENYKELSAVLLDIVMPEMNGYEVLQSVRDNALFSQLPIIMVTGSEDEESRVKALSYGANDFILKPFNPEIVKHCLKNNIALNEAFATVNALKRDSLTGLYTRAAFFDLVRTMVNEKPAGYYIMASYDIDKFKVINDSYGPQKGDEVLKHIASVLKEGFSECGGICCRVSGDRFAVLYPAEFRFSPKLDEIVEKASRVEGVIAPLASTVGRYIVDDRDILPVAMYDRAVLAASTIKGKYDERVAIYDEGMRAHLIREQEIVTEMEEALRTRQFEAWYQPQINHATGALAGAEALVRWRHPQKGLVSPAEFIPIFEQNGFIYELDKFIWEEVCRSLRKWLDEGSDPVPVSVNISRYDIYKPGFIEVFPALLEKYGLPTELLRIEITESAFAQSLDTIVDIVKQLIEMGFTVEIDDFGSGYSSLNTLKHVPAQVVKLDMRFLEDSDDDKRGGNILESIVRMAKWLGMSVIAEGVEHKKQADYMESIGCCYIQGYYYARPMPLEDYEKFCRSLVAGENILTKETAANIDSNSLWDPNSMDTLIFSSYVGAACIFEYHNRNIELLRANRKFTAILGDGTMSVSDTLKLNWISCLSEESLDLVHDILNRSFETREEYTAEYVFLNIPGAPPKTYLRATMRVIASTGERMLVYCISENITAQRQAEENEQAAVEKKELASDQLKAIMDHVEIGIVASLPYNENAQIMFANDRFYQLLGYTREEYASEVNDPFMLFAPEEREGIKARILARVADGEPDVLDCYMIRRDGTRRLIRDAFSTCNFAGVDSPVQLSLFRDITDEKQTEIENMRTTEQIHLIMRDIDCGVTAAVLDEDGNISLIFSNDKFFEIHGYTREEYTNTVADKYSLIHPLDREKAREDTVYAYKSRTPASLEYRLVKKDNTVCWVRVNLSSTRFTGIEQNVHLCIFTDITNEKQAQQTILETDEQLRFLSDMSHELLAKADVEEGITASLHRLMEYFRGNRAYIFEFNDERRVAENTYEVCGENVSAEIDNLKSVPFDIMHFWFEAFEKDGYYAIDDISALDESRAAEKEQLSAQGIASLFVVPLKRDGKLIGMLGVDDPRRKLTHVNRLMALGDYIAVMLTRRDLNKQINSDNKVLTNMMNDMPGGFVRMLVTKGNVLKPFYFNEGFSHLTGMNREELRKTYLEDIHVGIHPDDYEIVNEAVEKMLADGKAHSSRYRLRHKNGGYIWVATFGRITVNSLGQVVLNAYFLDMTDQANMEETQKTILDNLPGGAVVYKYDNGKLTVVHINKQYWELIATPPAVDFSEVSPLAKVHPDDVSIIKGEIESAIAGSRDIECDIRLKHRTDGYVAVHVNGRLVPKESGGHYIYATISQISEETITYQKMLPLLLSAMMDSTSDMSFAKDMEFRYLSASRPFAEMVGKSSAAEIIGKTDYDLFDKPMADKFRHDDEIMLKNGRSVVDMVEIIPSADGSVRYSSTSKYPLRDGAGKMIGLYGAGHDITRAVRQSSQLQLIADSVPGGIATYTCTKGDFTSDNIKIKYFNDGFNRLFGFTHEEYSRVSLDDPLSLIVEADKHIISEQWHELMENNVPIDCSYRVHTKNGGFKWISHKAVASERKDESVTVNAILQDVTEQHELIEQLRIREEESNLAVALGGNIICRYDVSKKTLSLTADIAKSHSLPATISDVPYGPVKNGLIAAESAEAYINFFLDIQNGVKNGTIVYKQKYFGPWRWMEAKSSTIFSDDNKPVKAVISMCDVTERLEKETVYKKWTQSFESKPSESYTLFRCNLNNDASYTLADGKLLNFDFACAGNCFDERAVAYAEALVYEEDREKYLEFANSDAMLAGYYRGKRAGDIEYREILPNEEVRWLKLNIELVEYPNSSDIEAYLMYEDIDTEKRNELKTKNLSQTDPLTGVLNRTAFALEVDKIIASADLGTHHALLMLDIDGFKMVNDVFGHGAGDKTLINIANGLKSILRRDDLVCRLGGDEFVIFLSNVPENEAIAEKAQKICALARKVYSLDVSISGSVGIAVAPKDGRDFETLYKKIDTALYHIKETGKDNFAFYNASMETQTSEKESAASKAKTVNFSKKKRRMLIVDDNSIDYEMMQNIFHDEFIIEKAKDGTSALIRLRHYGSAISVVLLDLVMPGMDGFAVLEKIQQNAEMRAIPVIIVSGDDSRDSCLEAIRKGAADFITKPVDPDVLSLRVHSAVNKAENDRLRTKNSLLELQSEERFRYETALENSGICVVELNWLTGEFEYSPSVRRCLYGVYDRRKFWQILLSDMVADTATVQDMQQMVHRIAEDKDRTGAFRNVRLKTPNNVIHTFRMNATKITNEYRLTSSIIISLNDLEYKPEA